MKRVFFIFFLIAPFWVFASYGETTLPPSLQKGDLIAIVFPASYLNLPQEEAKTAIEEKAHWLELQGYRTVFYPAEVNPYGYLAGKDEERANALMMAWKNPEVKAIWCFRGGYGSARILDLLDYEWIKTHPKIFIGMSDITALHQAIGKQTGLVTFLAPVLNYFGNDDTDFDSIYAFNEMEKILIDGHTGPILFPEDFTQKEVMQAGTAQGQLVGGNLTLIASLCGTKWQLETDGKVLFLEDVGEESYHIDRKLLQLKQAGLLERPAAVILGTWEGCTPEELYDLSLREVFDTYFKEANYPVVLGFPSGHSTSQTTLPLNILCKIDTTTYEFNLLESPVQKSDTVDRFFK